MTIERITVFGLLAVFAAQQALAADFNERYSAWQGRAPRSQGVRSAQYAPVQYEPAQVQDAAELPGSMFTQSRTSGGAASQTEALPAPVAAGSGQRTIANVYSPPVHHPDYNSPMAGSHCATCSHGPLFEPGSDPIGTCHYGGGGWVGGGWLGGGWVGAGGGHCDVCGPGGCFCGACGGAGGGCDWGPYACNTLVWAKFDVLLWWRQGRDFPALITTDPTTESSTTAGILPDAEILFGGGRVGTDMRAGGRSDVGFFWDPRQCFGIGVRTFGIGKDAFGYNVASNNEPVLAIPFRDIAAGANDALLVAFPGLRTGEINVSGNSSLISNDVYGRILLCRDGITRLDFITGWQYARIADNIQLNTRSTVTEVGGSIPVGTVSTTVDSWRATNDFHGAIFGLEWQRNCGVWQYNLLTRMTIGNMHETMTINGSSRVAVPGQTPITSAGGVLTAGSNIGGFSRDEFTAITEIGVNLAYRFAPCTQLRVGYSFLYWNDIVSAGSAIDTTVGTAGGNSRPEFRFRHGDYWVQGINLGLTREF